ncbi:hypothetical protein AB5N19_08085 [Seiridium cardinale]
MPTIAGRGANDIGPRIDGISWALTAIAGVFLGTRIYVRLAQSRLWWDDYLLTASWVSYIAISIGVISTHYSKLLLIVHSSISTYAVTIGFGEHLAVVSDGHILTIVMLVSIAGVFTLLGAACSKTSFALTLLRLTNGRLKMAVWGIIITLNITLFVNAILPFLRCMPIEAAWKSDVQGKCFDIEITIRFSVFAAAYSAAMDWILAFVPWAVIMGLNMRRKEKIGVAVCMSLGFIAGATSIIRCIKLPLLESDDFTFRSGQLAIWTVAEIATTIMAASIPVLRVFLRKIVTVHPATSGGINPYHRSAADGTFLRSLRIASKGSEHTTTITSGARDRNLDTIGGGGRESKDHRMLSLGLSPESNGRIMKIDTIAVAYDQRRSDVTEEGSTLVDDGSGERSSIELGAMPELRMHGSRNHVR